MKILNAIYNNPRYLYYWLVARWSKYKVRSLRCFDSLMSRPPYAIPPNFADLWFLYKQVRKRKPRCILELGSGCSTVVLAQALFDNAREDNAQSGLLYSLEADPTWLEVTEKSMPEYLKGIYNIVYSPLIETEWMKIPALRYSVMPDIVPEFIYADGPKVTPEREITTDILEIEDRFPPQFYMVLDGRWITTMFLRRYLKNKYLFTPRWTFGNSTFERIPGVSKWNNRMPISL